VLRNTNVSPRKNLYNYPQHMGMQGTLKMGNNFKGNASNFQRGTTSKGIRGTVKMGNNFKENSSQSQCCKFEGKLINGFKGTTSKRIQADLSARTPRSGYK
jgi:hypothetical protein